MNEASRVLYVQTTYHRDGSTGVSAIVETVLVDDSGEFVAVKDSRSVNLNFAKGEAVPAEISKVGESILAIEAAQIAAVAAAVTSAEVERAVEAVPVFQPPYANSAAYGMAADEASTGTPAKPSSKKK